MLVSSLNITFVINNSSCEELQVFLGPDLHLFLLGFRESRSAKGCSRAHCQVTHLTCQ